MAKIVVPTTMALRKRKNKELHENLREAYRQYEAAKVATLSKKDKNTASVRSFRITIARIKTVMGEKRDMELLQVKQAENGKKSRG